MTGRDLSICTSNHLSCHLPWCSLVSNAQLAETYVSKASDPGDCCIAFCGPSRAFGVSLCVLCRRPVLSFRRVSCLGRALLRASARDSCCATMAVVKTVNPRDPKPNPKATIKSGFNFFNFWIHWFSCCACRAYCPKCIKMLATGCLTMPPPHTAN